MYKRMQYTLNNSGTRVLSTEIKITQFPSGFCRKVKFISYSNSFVIF